MNKKYIPLMAFCLIFQWSIAQDMDRQRALSNISSLVLETEKDFSVFEDSIDYNRSVLSEHDIIDLYQRAVDQSKKIKNDSLLFHFSKLLTILNVSISAYDNAILAGKVPIEHAAAIKDTLGLISGLATMGGVYMYQNSLVESYDSYIKALNLAKAFNNKRLVNFVSIDLSSFYTMIGREDDAVSLLKSLIAYYEGLETPDALIALSTSYSILSGIELKDTLETIYFLQELERITLLIENHSDFEQNKRLQSSCEQAYYKLFNYYTRRETNLEKMEYYYQKLINSDIRNKTIKYLTSFHYAIMNKDLAKAKMYIKKENEEIYGGLYNSIALEYYQLTGNFKQQLYYTNLLKNDEIESLKADKANLNNFTNLQLENVKKTNEVALLEQEIDNQNLQRKYLFSTSFLLTGLLLSILYAFLQIRKRNKSLEEQKSIIEQQANKLKKVNEQKSIFFANVAHEFQTPLSIINGLAKKIRSLNNIEEAKPLLPIIIRNGTQLSEFTTQVLDLTKNEETSYPLNKNHFYVDELIKYQIHELQYLADAKNIKIELQNTLGQQIIFSDIHKFKTIIKNLVSNAIKFSPLNATVLLKLKAIDEKNITIAIADQGKGIPQEDLTTIFDRFYQSNNEKEEGGFGIGLAICKEYTNALGGHLDAQSILNQGSQFVLQMPTNINGEAIESSTIQQFPIEKTLGKTLIANTAKQDKSILILEDNLDFCKYLSLVLSKRYQLMFFHNAYDALEYLKSNSPDLIITDWMLPEIDGLEFLKTLRNTLIDKKVIPVLMLTARGMMTDQLKALKEGADDYLVKNFEEEILIQRIEHLLLCSGGGLSNSVSLNNTSLSYQIVENISKQDQAWLLKFESVVSPKIKVFELNLEEIASMMNMSVTHLGRKVKTITGVTPKKYIQEMRFWEARRILELGLVDSVKAACYSVGFKDQSHFSKKFKAKFGKYPSDYLNPM